MKKRIIAILTVFAMLISGICVQAAEFGTALLDEEFDSGFDSWTKEGSPVIENVKGVNAVALGYQETVRYNPKSTEYGWEDSYRATFKLKTKDWLASGNPTMLFRMKSQGNSQVYLIYYTAQGFSVVRLNPSLPSKTLTSGYSGKISADSSKWHEVSIDAIRNVDKSMTLKVYFDGEKQLEVTDTDVEEMPVTGGVMVGNWMKDNKVYVDSVKVEPIIIKNETINPDDPAPDTVGTDYEEDANLLRMLGIMDNYTDKLFRGDYIMTRQEFVKCVVSLIGCDEIAHTVTEKSGYSDVSGDLEGYITVAKHLGIISGTGNDKFEPERALTFDEAVKMLVCALGYNFEDLQYPYGYNQQALKIGLLKNIKTHDTSRGMMTKLLINALNIPLIELKAIGNYGNTYGEGKTVLEKFDIYCDEGIVTDNGITSYIGDSTIPKDSVCIDHIKFKKGITSADKYFGQNVMYYYKEVNDEDYELVYIRPTDKNTIYTFDADDIAPSTTKNKIGYYKNDKVKILEVSPICNFIYNGKAYPGIHQSEIIPDDGNIVAIDNDTDGIIDNIFISNYITVVAQYTSETTKTVYNSILGGESLVLDDEEKTIEIIKEDEKIDFSQIKSGDVIKAAISMDGEYIKAMVSSDKISGIVDCIDDDILTIDGEEYKIGRNLNIADFDLGSAYLFRLDFEGRIAFAENSITQTFSYGFLKNAINVDAFRKTVKIEVFTAKGEWKTFELAKKLRFNDSTKKREELYTGSYLSPQLIVYSLNSDGLVNKIKTAVDNASEEDIDYVTVTDGRYLRANRSFDSKYFLTDAIVFSVPADTSEEGLYRVTDCEYLRDGQMYDAKLYKIRENCPEVAVVEEIDTFSTDPYVGSSVMLVGKEFEVLNRYEVPMKGISGFYDGKAVEYIFSENVDGSEIQTGDVIQLTVNANKEIINKKLLVDESNITYKDDGGYFSTTRKVTGKVCKVYPTAKRFVVNLDNTMDITDTSIWCECSRISSKIYVYDRTKRQDQAKLGTFDDIEPGDDVFVRMDREWIYDIVIYKN